MIVADYPQYVRDLVKAAANGDEHAGHVLRYISSTDEERDEIRRHAVRREALERERPDR